MLMMGQGTCGCTNDANESGPVPAYNQWHFRWWLWRFVSAAGSKELDSETPEAGRLPTLSKIDAFLQVAPAVLPLRGTTQCIEQRAKRAIQYSS